MSFAQSWLALFRGNQESYKWNAAVKHMIRTKMKFPFGKTWCWGCELGIGRSHTVLHIACSASCSVRTTQSHWLLSEADYFLCAIGTVHKAVENRECHWVAQFLLLELIANCCGSSLQFGYYPWTLKVLIRLYSLYFLVLIWPLQQL